MTPLPVGLLWLPRLALLLWTGIVLVALASLCNVLWSAWSGITLRRTERAEQTLRHASLTNVLAAEVLAQIRIQRVALDPETGALTVTARSEEEAAEILSQSGLCFPRGQP